MPDKQQAWEDLHRLTEDEDSYVRFRAAESLGSAFTHLPDKQKAWDDLIRLSDDKDKNVRSSAASVLVSAFSELPDIQMAWNNLHRLTKNKDKNVRFKAASALTIAFSYVSDIQMAWNDLHRLINDENSDVRWKVVETLGPAFSQVSDKQQAWNDLHTMANDEDWKARSNAAKALGSAFPQVPDKLQAWNDLHKLTNDNHCDVRSNAAEALGSAFPQVPDKQQAWSDLHKLTIDESWSVRSNAAKSLGSAFPQVPDKQQAWNDLHTMANDEDWDVRSNAAKALSSAFPQVPDKQQAWNDLHRMTKDEVSSVRTFSYHSLGRVSIFKASQANKEEDYKKELEKAIYFFEIAAKVAPLHSPSKFCLPFYRSFHTIIFKVQEAKEEVNKYLEEAKAAIEDSESKKQLFEAVENLSKALKEVHSLGNLDLEAKKDELNFYRKYCDQAAELMRDSDDKAPFVTEVLRKGLPILDRNLKKLLEEIQKKAKTACQVSQGTATQEIACAVNREVQKWEIGSQEEMTWNIKSLIFTLEANTPQIPENHSIIDRIKQIPEQKDIAKQYGMLDSIITLIIKSSLEQKDKVFGKKVDQLSEKLDEIKELRSTIDRLTASIDELQNQQEYLDKIKKNLEEIKDDIPEMKGKIDDVLDELNSPLSTDHKLKVSIPIIPSLVSYETETNVPKFVSDRIDELKNLVLSFKKPK